MAVSETKLGEAFSVRHLYWDNNGGHDSVLGLLRYDTETSSLRFIATISDLVCMGVFDSSTRNVYSSFTNGRHRYHDWTYLFMMANFIYFYLLSFLMVAGFGWVRRLRMS